MVTEHAQLEEDTMFAAIRNNCSDQQREQMATKFKQAKSQIQEQLIAKAS